MYVDESTQLSLEGDKYGGLKFDQYPANILDHFQPQDVYYAGTSKISADQVVALEYGEEYILHYIHESRNGLRLLQSLRDENRFIFITPEVAKELSFHSKEKLVDMLPDSLSTLESQYPVRAFGLQMNVTGRLDGSSIIYYVKDLELANEADSDDIVLQHFI